MIEALKLVGKARSKKTETYQDALELLNARINNLETNLHIEIDLERTEDRSKALSFIGIEVAEALKTIPRPANIVEEKVVEEDTKEEITEELIEEKSNAQEILVEEIILEPTENEETIVVIEENTDEQELIDYQESVLENKKPSLWEKFKNSKLARAVSYVFKIRVRIKIELPNALPEGRGE